MKGSAYPSTSTRSSSEVLMKEYYKPGTQIQSYWKAHDFLSGMDRVMMDLLFGANPITDEELKMLINRYPRYERYRGYLGKRE